MKLILHQLAYSTLVFLKLLKVNMISRKAKSRTYFPIYGAIVQRIVNFSHSCDISLIVNIDLIKLVQKFLLYQMIKIAKTFKDFSMFILGLNWYSSDSFRLFWKGYISSSVIAAALLGFNRTDNYIKLMTTTWHSFPTISWPLLLLDLLRLCEKLHALTLLRLTVYIFNFLINIRLVIIKADSMLDRDLCSTSNSRFKWPHTRMNQ